MKNAPELLVSVEVRGNITQLPAIDVKLVELEIMPEGNFFLAKSYYYDEPTDLWQVFEQSTGKPVGGCEKTRKKAVAVANEFLARHTQGDFEKFTLAVSHWPKIN